ncbi:uncharacterized protein BX663DRAFT_501159 [Cokeromyces recurvatus]|uniref:uncharacterized protein n=1 Tax=Cokeromyces recurvatus TaxID=90255 RepID=UPI00221FAC41|nr:uncharacterized protein BX663DRAFT_501159 [Cokeromyces recurvatus]KAI7904958.1 hypothetical protein BX663DRAFT_501159 [Cokeromyces recurvatus]
MNDRLDQTKLSNTNKDSKALVTIVSSFIDRYNTSESSHQDGEAKLIIEGLRPFIMNCIISSIKSAKFDWLTYHLLPHPTHPNNQTMISDFTLFVDPLSTMNFELFFVEVKRPGNTSNGTLENDLTKLGKEMQIALSKLVLQKVDNPVVVGLLIKGTKASTFKMDIAYNGQYRMVELSQFHLLQEYTDDIMLVPIIMEKMFQIQAIIKQTINNIYEAINDKNIPTLDASNYIRYPCGSPLVVKK